MPVTDKPVIDSKTIQRVRINFFLMVSFPSIQSTNLDKIREILYRQDKKTRQTACFLPNRSWDSGSVSSDCLHPEPKSLIRKRSDSFGQTLERSSRQEVLPFQDCKAICLPTLIFPPSQYDVTPGRIWRHIRVKMTSYLSKNDVIFGRKWRHVSHRGRFPPDDNRVNFPFARKSAACL